MSFVKQTSMEGVRGGGIQIGYLRGVVMPNGEFRSGGNCFWIRDDPEAQGNYVSIEDIFIEDHDECEDHESKEE